MQESREAIKAKNLEEPNKHLLNPTRCFGCDRRFDSGTSSGYKGLVSCFCGLCLIAALDKNAKNGL